MATQKQIDDLRIELALLKYVAMSDAQRLAELEALDKIDERETIETWEILAAVDLAEKALLSVGQRADLDTLLGLGVVNIRNQSIREFVSNIFKPNATFPVTRGKLSGLQTRLTSRKQQLGLDGLNIGWVQEARS